MSQKQRKILQNEDNVSREDTKLVNEPVSFILILKTLHTYLLFIQMS